MKTNLLVLTVALLAACTHTQVASHATTATDGRTPANARQAVLPDQAQYDDLYNFADTLDLTDARWSVQMHQGEGTSVYGVISPAGGGKPIGAIIVQNSSGSVTGETLSFPIARALGFPEIVQPAVYHYLTGANLQKFISILPSTPIVLKSGALNKNKELNRLTILQRYKDHPEGMDAVFKRWDVKPADYNPINGDNRKINPTYVMPGSHDAAASMLTCEGPRPDAGTRVTFAGGSTDELSAVRQLSNILILDALEMEWDRFSGGNLQTVTTNGVVRFVAIDNGGTWGTGSTERNLSMVTRFDKTTADRVLAMDDFLQHRSASFMGLRSDQDFRVAFDIAQPSADQTFVKFRDALAKTAAHIRAHAGCYF